MTTSTLRGNWPAGARSGISWIAIIWWSMKVDKPCSISSGCPSASVCGYVVDDGGAPDAAALESRSV